MESKKISYITLISDLYLLVGISFIIYSIFFGFERIGRESFNIVNITKDIAIIICILEIIYSIVTSVMLYKCNKRSVRYTIMITSFIVVIYRIINMFMVPSIFTGFMLLVSFVLIIHLLFY